MNAIKVILSLILGNLIPHFLGLVKSDTNVIVSVGWVFLFVVISLLAMEYLVKKLKKKPEN